MTEEKQSVPPLREASTIILAREKKGLLEIYLLKRSTKSGFMGGLYVFPGGAVDLCDRDDSWHQHLDLSSEQIKQQLGSSHFPVDTARGFAIAAIRETLEEAGVFIASGRNKTFEDIEDMALYRLKKDLSSSWFKTKIMAENWILSLSSLGRWSHWITPKLMKKRFDTRFFIVLMPKGQTCVPDNFETKHGVWLAPRKALEQNLEARTPLSPPTVVTLTQLLKFNTLDELEHEMHSRPWGDPIAPALVSSSNGPVILEPWDPMYDTDIRIDTSGFSDKVLEPGCEFSRIWCDNGLWKPVGL